MKTKIKRIISCILFSVILITLLFGLNQISLNKANNRYYVLEKFLKEENRTYDLQVYGSCHAYTSFNAKYFEEKYGVSAYVLANPSEIIPITYLRMNERFKTNIPKVVLLDIWGMNPYKTYINSKTIFEEYSPVNLELLPYSSEKAQVIQDFPEFDKFEDNIALIKYKDRFLERSIGELDFRYSFKNFSAMSFYYNADEMKIRKNNNGYLAHNDVADVSENMKKQPKIKKDDVQPYEEDIMKYLEKIILLCKTNNVKLILYRAPYESTKTELQKENWLKKYCAENDITYYNMEKEIKFNYKSDFLDEWHLNTTGANKVTNYLAKKIMEYIE